MVTSASANWLTRSSMSVNKSHWKPEVWPPSKKTGLAADQAAQERFRETTLFLTWAREQLAIVGTAVMGCLEEKLRQALQQDARRCLEELLNEPSVHVPGDQTQPGESCHAERVNTGDSLFGPLTLRRNYYDRRDGTGGRVPLDESLGVIEGCTPGLARLLCRAGALEPYEDASQSLEVYCGVAIEGRRIQRLVQRVGPEFARWTQSQPAPTSLPKGTTFYVEADGTGVPVRPEETVDRKGKGEDGQARTREIKLGVVFTQDVPKTPAPVAKKTNRKKSNSKKAPSPSRPERVEGSTRYVTTTGNAQEFGEQLRQLALRQGLSLATLVVFLGDGAAWVWELARVCFPMAKLILDFYHAAEHVGLLIETLFGKDTPLAKTHRETWIQILKDEPDGVDELIRRASDAMPGKGKKRRLALKALAYFENHRDKMRYWEYQAQDLFFGSGVVEAGCKTVVGQRLKQSGMFWGLPGAHNILDIRCVLENGQFDAFWNRCLPIAPALAKAA